MQHFSAVRQRGGSNAILSGVGQREEFCWAGRGREELANKVALIQDLTVYLRMLEREEVHTLACCDITRNI